MPTTTCKWTQGFDGNWVVSCLPDGENKMLPAVKPILFAACPFCGKKIEAKGFNPNA